MNSYKRLGKNIILMALGSFGTKIISFLLVPLYTSVLTSDAVGTADLVFTLCSLIMPCFTLGIYFATMRFSLDEKADHSQILSSSLYIMIFGFFLFLLLSPLVRISEILRLYYIPFVLYCLMQMLHTVLLHFIRGIDRVKDYSIATIVNAALALLFNIIFLLVFRMDVLGYLLAYILASLGSTAYAIFRIKAWKYLVPMKRLDASLAKKMMQYSIPMIPNSVSWWFNTYSSKLMLILFSGISVSGLYAVANKIPSLLTIASTIFISAWQISSVDDFGGESSKRFFADVYEKYATLQYIITAAVIASSYILGVVLYKNTFLAAWRFVPILSIAVMFHGLGNFFGTVYTASMNTKFVSVSTVVGAVISVLLGIVLIPRMEAYGAALSTLSGYVIVFIIRVIHSRKFFRFRINYVNDVVCYLILLGLAYVMTFELKYQYLWGGLGIISICVLRWKSLQWFLCGTIQLLRKYAQNPNTIKRKNKKSR